MKKIILLALLCSCFCGNVSAQFSATLAGYPLVTTGWNVGGDAVVVDSTIRLTPSSTTQTGYVYYNTPVNLTTCAQFTVDFDFKIVASPGTAVADGIAFWYISNPPSGFITGGGIGLPTYPDGLIMIMDTYNNDGPADNNPLETLLGYNGTIAGYTEGSAAGVLCPVNGDQYFIDDGSWHHCHLTYNSGLIKVYFNYSTTPSQVGTYVLSINGYFGFSSSTGAAYSTQSVKDIYINAVGLAGPPAVADSVITYCQYATADSLVATASPGNPLFWYTTDTATVVSLPGSPTPNTSVPGTYWYFVRQGAGTCLSAPDSVEIIVNPQPAAPVLTGDTVYCEDSLFIPITATGTGILWYPTPTGGTGSATSPVVNTTIPGTYTYYATQTVAGCESPRDSISIVVHSTPATPTLTGGNTTYCQYTAFVPFTVTGSNILWYTTPAGGTGSSTAPVVNTSVVGVYDYYVSQTDSGCESQRLHIPVTVYARPPAPAVTPVIYCQGVTAAQLTAVGTGLTWYGTGVTPGYSVAPTPSTAITGTFDYYVTQTISGCAGDSATLIVVIDSTPATIAASVNSPICQGDTLYFTAATATAGVTYNWVSLSGGAFTSTLQNPEIDGAPVTATGLYQVTVTLGSCPTSAEVIATVNVIPTFSAISNNSPVCSQSTLTMSATFTPSGGTYNWYGPQGYTAVGQTQFINNIPTVDSGSYYVSETLAGCTSDTVMIKAVIDSTPAKPVAFTNAPVCQGDTLQLTATDATPGVTYGWGGPDGFTSTLQDPSITNVPIAADGYYTVTATLITGGLTCSNSAITPLVSITATPFFTPTSNSPVCSGDTLFLHANGAAGSAYTWTGPYYYYASSAASDPVISNTTIENAGVYTVTALLNGCTTVETDTVVINATPLPPFISWLTYCQYYPAPPLMATGSGILWYLGDSATAASTVAPPVPQTTVVGTTFYFATQTVNGCMSVKDSIQVTVNPTPTVTVTPSEIGICPHTTFTITAADTDPIAYYHWYPAMYLSNTNTASVVVNAETNITYSVVASNQFGCADTAATAVVVYPAALISLGDSVTIYPGNTYTMSPATNCTSFSWFPPAGLSSNTISDPVASPSISTEYYLYGTTDNGCTTVDSINIYVTAESLISLPNAFTPGTGANSLFKANVKGLVSLNYFRIFDRWGQKVFETTDINAGWDGTFSGTAQPFGVYVYEIEAITSNGQNIVKHGNLTLLR